MWQITTTIQLKMVFKSVVIRTTIRLKIVFKSVVNYDYDSIKNGLQKCGKLWETKKFGSEDFGGNEP